jgi:glycosyltransferase involved in cell wall biosynthesis/SAM-dependent methyltransferase
MFDGNYISKNQTRIKNIIDFYGHKFIYMKKVLDLGTGHGDMGGSLYRLGADVTLVDARAEHLKIASKKFQGIKTITADLDRDWPFKNKKFDIVLDLDLICHLRDYETHLKNVCSITQHLILETAVCDSPDPNKCFILTENKGSYDLSVNGVACRPTAAAIERILNDAGMNFKRIDSNKLNVPPYVYDWVPLNNDDTSINKRRMWYCVKKDNAVQIAATPKPLVSSQFVGNPNYNLKNQNSFKVIPRPPGTIGTQGTNAMLDIYGNPISHPKLFARAIKPGDKKFVIVIPSYKNSAWCVQNITSALNQNYHKYRIIFTDDCSPDNTFELVSNAVAESGKEGITTLIKNTSRLGALHNLYNMIHSCQDDEIILTLDGDDWFPDSEVLNKLNREYSGANIYMTYGQYKNSTDGISGVAQPYPAHIVEQNNFRSYTWCASHLRTFYAWLFKNIKKEDLMYQGNFFVMTWDFAIMFPMLEQSREHSKYLNDILYVYNLDNPINDHKVNVQMQQDLDRYIRTLPRYEKALPPPAPKTKIGLLVIATGKYEQFIQGLITSADTHFFNTDKYEITYYLFTDKSTDGIVSGRKIINIPIEHKGFPSASMDRFRHFTNAAEKLKAEDYLYYVDVDCLFMDKVGEEILGNLVGTLHCGYINKVGPYETNAKSTSYVEPSKYTHYFGGGFSGGAKEKYLLLSSKCADNLDIDTANGIIPIWHDESAINKYFSDNSPDTILTPSYHFPQTNLEHYKQIWYPSDYKCVILLLDKNHQEIRQ